MQKTVNNRTRVFSFVGSGAAKTAPLLSQPSLSAFLLALTTLLVAVPAFGIQEGSIGECLAREGRTSIIDRASRTRYESKLCVTPDEVARYVFLTNRRDDGDRSGAVYRASRKKGSLPGNFWVTATVADDATHLRANVRVRRFDAPLPTSVANVLHKVWLAVCRRSRTQEEAIPSAPSGVFSVLTASNKRLTAVTVSLDDENSVCISLLNLGESLIEYAKLPESQRAEAARKIEKESYRLLKFVTS